MTSQYLENLMLLHEMLEHVFSYDVYAFYFIYLCLF